MIYRIAADVVLLAHFPAAAWGAFIEFSGRVCPLTPLENQLRIASGSAGYTGGFIERYLIPVIYPSGLDRSVQVALGLGVLFINAIFYGLLVRRWTRTSRDA